METDFEKSFSNTGNCLIKKWPALKRRLIELLWGPRKPHSDLLNLSAPLYHENPDDGMIVFVKNCFKHMVVNKILTIFDFQTN